MIRILGGEKLLGITSHDKNTGLGKIVGENLSNNEHYICKESSSVLSEKVKLFWYVLKLLNICLYHLCPHLGPGAGYSPQQAPHLAHGSPGLWNMFGWPGWLHTPSFFLCESIYVLF